MKTSVFNQRYELIKSHILDPQNSPLPEKQQEILDRVMNAARLLDKNPLRKNCVALHQKKYPNISRTTAFIDLNLATKLYNTFQNFDYDFYQTWLINDIIKNIKECENHGSAAHKKIIASEHANLIKAIGKKPENLPDPSRHEKHKYLLIVNLGNTKVEMDVDDLNKLPVTTLKEFNKSLISGREITDIEAEEIINS